VISTRAFLNIHPLRGIRNTEYLARLIIPTAVCFSPDDHPGATLRATIIDNPALNMFAMAPRSRRIISMSFLYEFLIKALTMFPQKVLGIGTQGA